MNGPSPTPLTIFAMPKAFRGHIGLIQRNAIGSWLRLTPRPQIILFGDDEGTAEMAAANGLLHEPQVARNEHGTPLMSDMFRRAQELATHEVLAYVNGDIVLLDDFSRAVDRATASEHRQFLLVGRRVDVNLFEPIDFDRGDWRERLQTLAAQVGAWAPRVCKDYFVYRKPLFAEIPPFAIGRAVYDNWFLYHAKQSGVPVIEATPVVRPIHQNHDYGHVSGGSRGQAYVKSEEAQRNKQLAGGKMHLIAGSTADWVMTPRAIRRRRIPSDLVQFAADAPRFLKLVLELYGWIDGSFRRAAAKRKPVESVAA